MSERTIADIHQAIQNHIDSCEGPEELLTDFVVMFSTLDAKGNWSYAYTNPRTATPHTSLGLATIVGAMLSDNVIPVAPED